jgi:hypothetical protein
MGWGVCACTAADPQRQQQQCVVLPHTGLESHALAMEQQHTGLESHALAMEQQHTGLESHALAMEQQQ